MLWPHRWKFLLLASTISLVSVFTGCLGSRGWDYPPPPKGTFLGLTASRPITASLVVLPFNDVRGTEEQVEYWKVAIPLVPSGKTFYDQPETALKPEPVDEVRFNPPRDFSRALADEIREANVFSSVAFADTSTAITSDLVLHGNLRSTRWERDITTYLLGPMGTVFWFIGLPLGKITTNLEMDPYSTSELQRDRSPPWRRPLMPLAGSISSRANRPLPLLRLCVLRLPGSSVS